MSVQALPRLNPSLRLKDKVSDAVNELYNTEHGRQTLASLLEEHGDFQSVNAKLTRKSEQVVSNLDAMYLSYGEFYINSPCQNNGRFNSC